MGVKYKLKKEYPGSPKLGSECTQLENDTITAYPEYWEEVIEKDYEILSISSKRSPDDIRAVKEWGNDGALLSRPGYKNTYYPLKDNLEFISENYNIHSILRKSDGEVFTIGDNTNFGKIEKFVIYDGKNIESFRYGFSNHKIGEFHAWFEKGSDFICCGYQHLANVQKVKTLLFKTEDGVDIFEGDNYYAVHKKTLQLGNAEAHMTVNKWHFSNGDWTLFSTKAAAEDYIFKNKAVLSYNEVSELFKNYFIDSISPFNLNERLIKKVEKKIK